MLQYSLLDEPLIRARLVKNGQPVRYTLPGLFVALAKDEVRDFPALRPHQRHPWHAFLVQLAAMALHHAQQVQPFTTEQEWKDVLLALTPEHPDGAAWCLISPHDKPAFMQAPVPGGNVDGWTRDSPTPDSMDVLVMSKNHDLKRMRARRSCPEDWIFALVSIQTQAPYSGRNNYGVARMSSGHSSRPGLGIKPAGNWGARWLRDVRIALKKREEIVDKMGLMNKGGKALLWLYPWDGIKAFSFSELDPFFIEICRRIRLENTASGIVAIRTATKNSRISAKSFKGNTGDLWTPIKNFAALDVEDDGFNYKLMSDLAFSAKYIKPLAQNICDDDEKNLVLVAQAIAIAGDKCQTKGYYERRIPISPKMYSLLRRNQIDQLAKIAGERVDAIGKIRGVLQEALMKLFRESNEDKKKAERFAKTFEQAEDARFFDELNAEIEAADPEQVRLQWLLAMADRAESILKNAFVAGPQSGDQRYRARSAALSYFHDSLRSEKVLPTLANYYHQSTVNKEISDEPA